ncbi:MAG: hypothetical protein SGBAC_003042 [Bacillariaceae sp.]
MAPKECSMRMVDFIELPTETREVRNLSDMSSEAISKTWYSQDEISVMKTENSRACFLLQRSKYLEDMDAYCYRGLEHIFLPDYRVRRQKVMSDARDAVMNEQDRQLIANAFNDELVAAAYREAVLYATRIARRRGIRDEEERLDAPPKKNLEPESPTNKKQRTPVLKVKFNDRESSRIIPCISDLSEEEKSTHWLRRNEYKRMRMAAIEDAISFLQGNALESDDFTVQGLEKYLPNLSMIRRRNRLHAVSAVFEEQELQELEGTNCPIRIAKAYQSNSIHCVLIAQQAGLDAGRYRSTSNRNNVLDKSHHLVKTHSRVYTPQFQRLPCL